MSHGYLRTKWQLLEVRAVTATYIVHALFNLKYTYVTRCVVIDIPEDQTTQTAGTLKRLFLECDLKQAS